MTIDFNCIRVQYGNEAHNHLKVTHAERINIKDDEIEIDVIVEGGFRKFLVDRSKVLFYEVWNA